MTKRMLIDATHAEETRVVVLDGTRLEDFDVETSTKRQLKGNIYLAKVVRVEPSLQAAFVEYGGNRHGFLAFSEIHPDYYQIPVADRQRLIEMQAEDARREEEEDDLELALSRPPDDVEPVHQMPVPRITEAGVKSAPEPEAWASAATPSLLAAGPVAEPVKPVPDDQMSTGRAETWARPETPLLTTRSASAPAAQPLAITAERVVEDVVSVEVTQSFENGYSLHDGGALPNGISTGNGGLAEDGVAEGPSDIDDGESYDANGAQIEALPPPESVGGGDHDSGEDHRERRIPPRFLRNYKIQEVIRRRQILLVQVVKEERGTKGAALTTYLSLAGRFGVLMPNSPRGGGISRKITSATDRRRLKEVMQELDIPRGMGMIVRTAGANRPKPEIKRDCEYLLRLWDDIRESTMKSVAPALIYEEASLIKRAIRDVYSRDIDEILVDGEDGWRAAHDFMRMLMPSHAKKVQLWRDGGQPLFARNQVEAQLDGMLMPTVQLRSGGYLVINQAEALVAIDVNSGRSTRERNIEETALRTNLEAADEVARQLRLRDLAGLIVIDFIDMESKRHNAMVERRIKEALKNDRARIQVGHISHFGLLEMSRQRLRPSLAETSFIPCPHCGGTGHVRSTENAAIHVLRGIEDEGGKRRSAEIIVHVSTPVALYLLNHKRERIREIEIRYTMRVIIAADDAQIAPQFRIERVRTRSPDEMLAVVAVEHAVIPAAVEEPEDEEEEAEAVDDDDDDEETAEEQAADAAGEEQAAEAPGAMGDEAERRRKRRRKRRRGGRRDEQQPVAATATPDVNVTPNEVPESGEVPAEPAEADEPAEAERMPVAAGADAEAGEPAGEARSEADSSDSGAAAVPGDEDPRNRRRGRRGGRRRRRENEGEMPPFAVPGADQPELQPVYAGPTPADPFGGRVFDIFDVMDQAERAAESRPAPRASSAAEIVTDTTIEAAEPERVVADPGVPGRTKQEAMPTAAEQVSTLVPDRPAVAEAVVAEVASEPDRATAGTAAAEPEPVTASVAAAEVETAKASATVAEPALARASALAAVPERVAASAAADLKTADAAVAERESAAADVAVTERGMAIANAATPEPVGRAGMQAAPAEVAESPVPANDTMAEIAIPEPPSSEPLIKPILVGADGEAPAEKKRGWWRR